MREVFFVPKFPYSVLGRAPLIALVLLVFLLLATTSEANYLAFIPPPWRDGTLAAMLFVFSIAAVVQIVAVPYGILVASRAHALCSLRCALALLCGISYLGLFTWLVIGSSRIA